MEWPRSGFVVRVTFSRPLLLFPVEDTKRNNTEEDEPQQESPSSRQGTVSYEFIMEDNVLVEIWHIVWLCKGTGFLCRGSEVGA